VLVLSLLIPWGILLYLAEPDPWPLGGERRFWWLWPLQVIMLAAFVTHVLPRVHPPHLVTWGITLGVVGIILANPVLLSRAAAWWHRGWTGPDAAAIQAIDAIADHLRGQGKRQAAIGYQILYEDRPAFEFFMATFNIIDPRYKVGANLDLLFAWRHELVNTNQCAEGISSADEYRMVQRSPMWTRLQGLAFTRDRQWRWLQQSGLYYVFTHP
jgi:hypothetical protein